MKTCSLEGVPDGPIKNALLKRLSDHDWIPLENRGDVDLIMSLRGKELFLEDGKGTVLKVPASDFPARSATVLKEYSNLTDRYHFFRRFAFYSLLMGFPVILYISLYSLIFFFVGRWVPRPIAPLLCAIVCLLTGVMLLMPLRQHHEWKGRQDETYPDLLVLLKDPSPMVVCAAISSLGRRGEKKAVPDILKQLRESQHPYVQWYAYKALKALGWRQKAR